MSVAIYEWNTKRNIMVAFIIRSNHFHSHNHQYEFALLCFCFIFMFCFILLSLFSFQVKIILIKIVLIYAIHTQHIAQITLFTVQNNCKKTRLTKQNVRKKDGVLFPRSVPFPPPPLATSCFVTFVLRKYRDCKQFILKELRKKLKYIKPPTRETLICRDNKVAYQRRLLINFHMDCGEKMEIFQGGSTVLQQLYACRTS